MLSDLPLTADPLLPTTLFVLYEPSMVSINVLLESLYAGIFETLWCQDISIAGKTLWKYLALGEICVQANSDKTVVKLSNSTACFRFFYTTHIFHFWHGSGTKPSYSMPKMTIN